MSQWSTDSRTVTAPDCLLSYCLLVLLCKFVSLFITFEGPEGSGKTTQIHLLENFLKACEFAILVTREPGGTTIGNAIRAIVLDPNHIEMSPRAEVLLFNAARAQIVDEVIRPALTSGRIVLCDRYADSTLAYQGFGQGVPRAVWDRLAEITLDGLRPDLTLVLDIAPAEGLARAAARGETNRYEALDPGFHDRVRAGFRAILAAEPAPCAAIDGTDTPEGVAAAILAVVRSRLGIG